MYINIYRLSESGRNKRTRKDFSTKKISLGLFNSNVKLPFIIRQYSTSMLCKLLMSLFNNILRRREVIDELLVLFFFFFVSISDPLYTVINLICTLSNVIIDIHIIIIRYKYRERSQSSVHDDETVCRALHVSFRQNLGQPSRFLNSITKAQIYWSFW